MDGLLQIKDGWWLGVKYLAYCRSPVNDRLERSHALRGPIIYGSGCKSAAFPSEISVEYSFSPVLARSVLSGGGFGLDLS